jgi:hypothetical protein
MRKKSNMSSFIVTKKTIDACVSAIMYNQSDMLGRRTPADLGTDLWNLNVDALNHRYDDELDYMRYIPEPISCTPIQAYKALRCLLYQCNEGDLKTCELYEKLQAFTDSYAGKILSTSPEYEKAQWDIGE